jgi:hypothetical protein
LSGFKRGGAERLAPVPIRYCCMFPTRLAANLLSHIDRCAEAPIAWTAYPAEVFTTEVTNAVCQSAWVYIAPSVEALFANLRRSPPPENLDASWQIHGRTPPTRPNWRRQTTLL